MLAQKCVDFCTCHRIIQLRKLNFVTLTYFLKVKFLFEGQKIQTLISLIRLELA